MGVESMNGRSKMCRVEYGEDASKKKYCLGKVEGLKGLYLGGYG